MTALRSLNITHNFRSAAIQSQRDSATKPKVASSELPWVSPAWLHNRDAIAIQRERIWTLTVSARFWPCFSFEPVSGRGYTSGLPDNHSKRPQGRRSFLALTLRFEEKSFWDLIL